MPSAAQVRDPRLRTHGPLHRLVRIGLAIPVALALGLLLSVAIEYIGIVAGWWAPDHTAVMLAREASHLRLDRTARFAGIPAPGEMALAVLSALDRSGVNLVDWTAYWRNRGFSETTAAWFSVPAGVVDVFALRLVICLYSLTLMTACVLVGLQEGLVRRELRKWGGGAESAFLYHHLKRWLRPLFILGWLVYLAAPFTVHPNWLWVPLGMVLGGIVMATATLWKRLT